MLNIMSISNPEKGCIKSCLNCYKKYVGETSYTINTQIYEHRRDLKRADLNNDLVKHNLETNHNFNFKDPKMLVYIYSKKHWKIVESSIISNPNTITNRDSVFKYFFLSFTYF